MPNLASQKKRMRQDVVRRDRNRARMTRLRRSLRRLDEAIEAGDLERVREQWRETQSLIDRTAKHGVIHHNTAARKKARLSRRIARLTG